MEYHENIKDFLKAHEGEVFRYLVYRRLFTPYEQKECFMDESVYEDYHYSTGIIVDCVSLDDDFLLGFEGVDDTEPDNIVRFGHIEYYKLSEIRLCRYLPEEGSEDYEEE